MYCFLENVHKVLSDLTDTKMMVEFRILGILKILDKIFFFAECDQGYFGPYCNISCPIGTFGDRCGGSCFPECTDVYCDPVKGCIYITGKRTTTSSGKEIHPLIRKCIKIK